MNEQDRLIRAAGILEGEGSFFTKTNGHAPVVACQMTDQDVIQELHDLFGGSISEPSIREPHHKKLWAWSVQGDAAEIAMNLIKPYMFTRRINAIDKALNVWSARKRVIDDARTKALAAAASYMNHEGSLREVAKMHGTSYETVRRYVIVLNGPIV